MSIRTDKKAEGVRGAAQQHTRPDFCEGACHLQINGLQTGRLITLKRLHEDENVVHTHS